MPRPTDEIINFNAYTTQDLSAGSRAAGFIDALRSGGDSWLPVAFGDHEPLRRAAGDALEGFRSFWAELDRSGKVVGHVFFRAQAATGAEGTVHWNRGPYRDFDDVGISVPLAKYRRRAGEFWRIAESLFAWADGAYGFIRAEGEFLAQHRNPRPGATYIGMRPGDHLPGVYYANFFGRELVAFFGRERLRTCPAVRNAELPGGGWLITTAREPDEWQTDVALELKRAVREHLGERVFFDVRDPDRATIRPFPPRVPAEPSPRASAGLEVTPVSAEFFPSPAAARSFMEGVLAKIEALRGRLRAGALDYTPQSLLELEKAVAALPGRPRNGANELVLELAAYFGEVVRRNMGGKWVFDEESGMPAIRLPDGRLEYPVIRAVKFYEDGDLLSDWYDFVEKGGERLLG